VRILIVGGGGREHALCWALRRENPEANLHCAPGNPGTAELATNLPIADDDIDRLADAADMYGIDLTIIGPEVPLALGLADRLRAEGRATFGPSRAAARIEASKAFAKEVMAAAGIPTAASATFDDSSQALRYLESHPEPLVVKASGLAAGKGAVVCATRREAAGVVRAMLAEGNDFAEDREVGGPTGVERGQRHSARPEEPAAAAPAPTIMGRASWSFARAVAFAASTRSSP